jgi:serine/threonine protein phosphatase PrpC
MIREIWRRGRAPSPVKLGKIDCYGLSDRGRVRETNEDQFLLADLRKSLQIHHTSLALDDQPCVFGSAHGQLLLVADGVGGHAAGERASTIAVDCVANFAVNAMQWCTRLDELNDEHVMAEWKEALCECNHRVHAESAAEPQRRGMGTTLTMAYVMWPRAYVIHAGDSRCYLFRDGKLERITTDHTLAQKFIEAGVLTPEQAENSRFSHVLWNAIGGSDHELAPEAHLAELQADDVLLLCTDGLTKGVDEARIARVLREGQGAEEMCRRLVKAANDAGGHDNVTAVVARFLSVADAPTAAAERSLGTPFLHDTAAWSAHPGEFATD